MDLLVVWLLSVSGGIVLGIGIDMHIENRRMRRLEPWVTALQAPWNEK